MTISQTAPDPFTELTKRIKTKADSLELNGVGAFWEAVKLGQRLGRLGRGSRIAICDTGLAEIPNGDAASLPKVSVHGTVVAPIARGIAPEAEYITTTFGKGTAGYRQALERVLEERPDIVNISAGRRRTLEQSWKVHGNAFPGLFSTEQQARKPRKAGYECCYCPPAEELAGKGTLITAAVGNGFDLEEDGRRFVTEYWCPSRSPNVVSSGFISVYREEAVAQAIPPLGYQQGSENAWAIEQPPGVEGSSFAAPLAAGALALVEDRSIVPALVDIRVRHGLIMALYPSDFAAPARRAEALRKLWNLYDRIPNSHQHKSNLGPCYECSMFLQGLLSDLGMVLIHVGLLDAALELLTRASSLVPWSPDIAANLGATYRLLSETRPSSRRELLMRSREMYRRAVELRPKSAYFLDWLSRVSVSLADLD